MWHRWSLCRASRKMTFYSLTAHIHLSSSHLCAETMTVWVACSAQCPGGSNSSRGALWALASQGVPRCFASIPPPLPPMCVFVSQGQGTKCWVIPIKLSGWKRLQMLLFLSLVLSPQSLLFSLPWILSALAARVLGVCVFKKLKKRGLWKRSWGLGFCNLWIAVFLNCLWLNSQKYKVNRLKQMDSFLVAPGYLLTTETLLFVLFTINSNIY